MWHDLCEVRRHIREMSVKHQQNAFLKSPMRGGVQGDDIPQICETWCCSTSIHLFLLSVCIPRRAGQWSGRLSFSMSGLRVLTVCCVSSLLLCRYNVDTRSSNLSKHVSSLWVLLLLCNMKCFGPQNWISPRFQGTASLCEDTRDVWCEFVPQLASIMCLRVQSPNEC